MNNWDMIQENLQEYWEIFILSIPKIAISLLIISIFILLSVFVGRLFRRKMQNKSSDSITMNFVIRMVRFVMVITGFILGLHALGFEGIAGGLLASAGVGAIIIGFAFKEIGENFLAGIILVFDRSFEIGDTVTINNNMGTVERLKFRTTHIKSFDGKDVYIPNADVIGNNLYNYTRDGFMRNEFIIGIDYTNDAEEALRLIFEKVNSFKEVLKSELTQVIVYEFGVNTVDIKVMFWVNTYDYKYFVNQLRSRIMVAVKEELLTKGFSLPANIHELKMYNKEPLLVQSKKNK